MPKNMVSGGTLNIIKSISRPNSVCWSIKNERILTIWTNSIFALYANVKNIYGGLLKQGPL